MIKLKTILLEASKASSATPSEYSGDNGNANKLSSTKVPNRSKSINETSATSNSIFGGSSVKIPADGAHKGQSGWQSNNAWDIPTPIGTPIYAVADGTLQTFNDYGPTVIKTKGKKLFGQGFTVKSDNGLPDVYYAHLKDSVVKKGDKVKCGQLLGYVMDFPNSSYDHLHIGVYKGHDIKEFLNTDGTLKCGGTISGKVSEPIQSTSGDKNNSDEELEDQSPEITGLQYGDRGTAVTDMQQHLMYLDFSVGPRMDDGIFGPYTKKGVESFQRDHDLSVNGVFDSDTEAKLDDLTKQVPDNQIQYKIDSLKKSKSKNTDTITSNIPYDSGTVKKWDNNVIDALDIAALDYDIPKEILYTIANIESTGNPNAKNKSTSASGLFQIMPRFFKDYGVTKDTVLNPFINAEAAAKMMKKHMSRINKIIDSKDQSNIGAYIYMTHQQGLAGFEVLYVACKMYSNLDSKESLIKAAVSLNRSESFGKRVYRNMKANGPGSPCEFINTWTSKYDRNVQEISGKL
jgi:murein DD-endopeptidase MepM/ murein hydrolase activator NlpD